jgi:PilZ domain
MTRSAVQQQDNRRAMRLDVRLAAGLREPGTSQKFEVTIIDLSVTGFRCETSFNLSIGQLVFVTIPTLGALEAVVMRRDGFVYGCAFERPLYTAVFDHIVRQHRKVSN